MPSLMELVDRVNKGENVDPAQLEIYQDSPNSAEKFLAHHAQAMLGLRRAHQHMRQSLEAIDYSDQKVLDQYVSIASFLGLSDLRSQPVIKFGASAIARREWALGLEAIQSGVGQDLAFGGAFTNERENCSFIATQYERASQAIGWTPGQSTWNNKQTRIGYIVSSLVDDQPSARTAASFARNYDSKRYKLQVYSTECCVRREKQQFELAGVCAPSNKSGAQTLETLSKKKVSAWMCPTDGDVVSAAKALADQLIKDQVDVMLFDCTQADAIAALVASWEVGRVMINLCRRNPMYMPGFNSVIYLDPVRWEADKDYWNQRNIDSRFILEGCDLDDAGGAAPQRSAYGIPESAMVLATSGSELDRTLSVEFVDTVINILRAHPQAIYLTIGEGELAWQKRKFESAGVSKRVGYVGKRDDLPNFLRICDIYLAEFPASGAQGVLQAMCVERPVVATRWGEEAEQSQAAALVGSEGALTGRDTSQFIERVSKLIRDAAYRHKLGKTMRQRVEQHFSFNQTAQHLEQLCDQLIQSRSESTKSDSEGSQVTLAEVA